ncbi:MAG: DUF3866 family protein [Actinomycetota bacterium]|nr:DUF3866 family protein [Actinomycetota bacterium]
MINFKTAIVQKIIQPRSGLTKIAIEIDGQAGKAINYDNLTGPVAVGDKVIVNTTAVDLSLGTGGYSFVLWNLSRGESNRNAAAGIPGSGHLMKLRYTPLQFAGLSVEEEDSPYHEALKDVTSIDGLPVIACELHSQLLPIAATLKELKPEAKVAYIMTDGGALPAAFSKTATWLRENGYLEAVITAGQAFGGDFEAVNIYSALAAAKYVVNADVTVVAKGPGIAGTGTALGHSGIEQGQIINAAAALGGRPIAVPRLSQADPRPRHQGLSHHTIAALTIAALAPAIVPMPELPDALSVFAGSINERIEHTGIKDRHDVRVVGNDITLPALAKIAENGGPKASTMGRGSDLEPAFFLAAGAAAISALNLV